MSNKVPWKVRLSGFVAAKGIKAWMSTLNYRATFVDQSVDACYASETPRIYIHWHEYILTPLHLRGHCNLAILLSRHKDADILAQVAHHGGFDCVRGSSNKGAAAALMELKRCGQHMHLAITPDGPRGPRRKMAIGPIYLASRLGLPIVPLGFGYDRPWRLNSWDRFAIPRPFSRCRSVVGEEIFVPANLERKQLETRRQAVERKLTELTLDAEDWAASGEKREGELRERPRSKNHFPAPPAKPELVIPFAASESGTVNRKSA